MNERIKELAGQANIHFSRIGILDGDPDGTARLVGYSKVEKFAELIVRECFGCIDIMEKIAHASNADIPPDYDQHTYLKTLEAVTGLMKAHFGVEL